ncbi:hypothetical protein CEXT_72701 [Caerostris extrusa]|uniref:Uncharacterized protein n=1 Tax=Caerostris extrusa TaxID=172846 RepID=A0AAV4W5P2_CAEEX|nr:hypothetical protein CEXT_72701 [Caerostris extrusa]
MHDIFCNSRVAKVNIRDEQVIMHYWKREREKKNNNNRKKRKRRFRNAGNKANILHKTQTSGDASATTEALNRRSIDGTFEFRTFVAFERRLTGSELVSPDSSSERKHVTSTFWQITVCLTKEENVSLKIFSFLIQEDKFEWKSCLEHSWCTVLKRILCEIIPCLFLRFGGEGEKNKEKARQFQESPPFRYRSHFLPVTQHHVMVYSSEKGAF